MKEDLKRVSHHHTDTFPEPVNQALTKFEKDTTDAEETPALGAAPDPALHERSSRTTHPPKQSAKKRRERHTDPDPGPHDAPSIKKEADTFTARLPDQDLTRPRPNSRPYDALGFHDLDQTGGAVVTDP